MRRRPGMSRKLPGLSVQMAAPLATAQAATARSISRPRSDSYKTIVERASPLATLVGSMRVSSERLPSPRIAKKPLPVLAHAGRIRRMRFTELHRAALLSIIAAAITLRPALDAGQSGGQSVQYRSPEGVEYRSLPDTDAVKNARAAFDAAPRNIVRIIDLGVAQSGARQFREAIATFTRGLEIEPDNALLLRWRGHRYLSVREFDRAFADLTRGGAIDSTIYGIWYHLGVVQYLRGDFADAAASFAKAQPIA